MRLWLAVGLALCASVPTHGSATSSSASMKIRRSWASLEAQSFDFGNSMRGFDNSSELQEKGRFSLVFLDAGTGSGGGLRSGCCNASLPGGGPTCHDACGYAHTVVTQAKRLKAVSPTTSVAIYTSAFCTSAGYSARTAHMLEDHAYDELWVNCVGYPRSRCPPSVKAAGALSWDFRNATARRMFATEWGSYIAGIDVLDGVYADSGDMMGCAPRSNAHNFTRAEEEAIFNGTVLAWRDAALEVVGTLPAHVALPRNVSFSCALLYMWR